MNSSWSPYKIHPLPPLRTLHRAVASCDATPPAQEDWSSGRSEPSASMLGKAGHKWVYLVHNARLGMYQIGAPSGWYAVSRNKPPILLVSRNPQLASILCDIWPFGRALSLRRSQYLSTWFLHGVSLRNLGSCSNGFKSGPQGAALCTDAPVPAQLFPKCAGHLRKFRMVPEALSLGSRSTRRNSPKVGFQLLRSFLRFLGPRNFS